LIPDTDARVPEHTAPAANERIAEDLTRRILHFAHRLDDIDRRLQRLDREWDIERTLETNAGVAMLAGVVLGTVVDRRFYALAGLAAAFLLQHALEGWCPPLPMFRRMGVRTSGEIAQERYALKALRGDFDRVADGALTGTPIERALSVLQAVEADGMQRR
jgi:hypothetical protein